MSTSKKSGSSNKCCKCSNCFKTNSERTKLTRQNKPTGGTWCCQGCGKPVNHKIERCSKHGTMWWECDPYGCRDCYLGNPPRYKTLARSSLKSYDSLPTWWKTIENPTEEDIQTALSYTYPGLF